MVRRCRRRRRAHTCRSARPDASLRRKRLLGCEWGLGKTGVFIPAITALSASFASLASSVSLFTGFRICDLLGLVWDGERSPPRRLTPLMLPAPAGTPHHAPSLPRGHFARTGAAVRYPQQSPLRRPHIGPPCQRRVRRVRRRDRRDRRRDRRDLRVTAVTGAVTAVIGVVSSSPVVCRGRRRAGRDHRDRRDRRDRRTARLTSTVSFRQYG